MRKTRQRIFILIGVLALSAALSPKGDISIQENSVELNFPESITFHLKASSSTQITSVQLEFGTDALACGKGVSKANPDDFDPDIKITAEWVWDLRRSGSIPPGTEVWWRWVLETKTGEIVETPVQRFIYLDDLFSWRNRVSEHISLYAYQGSEDFMASLVAAGESAITRMVNEIGVKVEDQVKIYIYASSKDMQEATLFAPDWSGGRAFPWNNSVIIGIAPSDLAWGQDTMAHELAHVVFGQYTFSCVDSTPGWISEGLAMVVEGDLEPYYQDLLQDAVDEDSLLSVRELGQIFSADPDLARLSYAESFSLVTYLLESFGDDSILKLLGQFKLGESEDRALRTVYGFDRDGLEKNWRAWLGAQPRDGSQDQGQKPTATLPPTLAPIVGPNNQPSPTPEEIALDSPAEPLEEDLVTGLTEDPGGSPVNSNWVLLFIPLGVLGVIGGGVIMLRRRNSKQDNIPRDG